MFLDLKKIFNNEDIRFKKLDKLYDYIIIGSGPASSVLVRNLIKTDKKILVVERGGIKKKFGQKLDSKNFEIKRTSRVFGLGGTSTEWSQIYSLFSKHEMQNFSKKHVWPLSHTELKNWSKKLDPKYKFNITKIDLETILKDKFFVRNFIEIKSPTRFSKYFNKNKFDIIINCEVKFLSEQKKLNKIFFNLNGKTIAIKSKKIIICAGGIESSILIQNSLKKNFLKNLKNKKFVGRYFMDHPKCYVGELDYPKIELIKNYKLTYKKKINTYSGISLYGKNKRFLNTYIRFEEKKNFFNFKKKIKIRIFFEMEPNYKNRIYLGRYRNVVSLSLSKKEIITAEKLLKEVVSFFSNNPEKEKLILDKNNLKGASHHMGGMIYPKLVNKNLQLQGIKNIYCCSSAIFPTSGSVNPTLVICALAQRLSTHLNRI